LTKDEALKLALKALENHSGNYKLNTAEVFRQEAAVNAIKEALAQPPLPVQEPVAWLHEWDDGERIPLMHNYSSDNDKPVSVRPLVFGDTPPAAQPAQEPDELTIAYMSGLYDGKKKRPWVGLTDNELADLWYKESLDWMEFARAHEAALRKKNT
jgi:hypothetical protein